MSAPRVSTDDLLTAAEWLDCYEPAPVADENGPSMAKVAAMLRREAQRREHDALARQIAKKHRVPVKVARMALESSIEAWQ